MKTLSKVLSWLFIVCGIGAYILGWTSLILQNVLWNTPTEFWFYDAGAAGVFAIFFLLYYIHNKGK